MASLTRRLDVVSSMLPVDARRGVRSYRGEADV